MAVSASCAIAAGSQKDGRLGNIQQRPSGLYVLDTAIGFNVLDGASFDPQTQKIMLFGHRDATYPGPQIPYFELLADLLDHPSPRFSLTPTVNSLSRVNKFMKGKPAGRIIKSLYGLYTTGRLNEDTEALLGLPPTADDRDVALRLLEMGGFPDVQSRFQLLKSQIARSALLMALNGPNGLLIDAGAIEQLFELTEPLAQSKPDYRGLDPNSSLAHAMFEGDYQTKGITNNPKLASLIPGYRTELSSLRSDPLGLSGTQYSISVAHVGVVRSVDGLTLETPSVRMQINVRATGPATEDLLTKPGTSTPYERVLSSLYHEIARHVPVLHELSETAKLAVVAQWLHSKESDFRLPTAGRTVWKNVESVPAHHYAYVYVSTDQSQQGWGFEVAATFILEGGVDLRPFSRSGGIDQIPAAPSVIDLRKLREAAPPAITGHHGLTPFAWVANLSSGASGIQVATIVASKLPCSTTGGGGTVQPMVQDAALQLTSVAKSGNAARAAVMVEEAHCGAMLGFDTAGLHGGPLVAVTLPPVSSSSIPQVPDKIRADPGFQALLNNMRNREKVIKQLDNQIAQVDGESRSAETNRANDLKVEGVELKQMRSELQSQQNWDTWKMRAHFHVDVRSASN